MSAHVMLENTNPAAETGRHRLLRWLAGVAAAVTAILYFLIGFRVLIVLDANADQSWAFFAGAAYTLGAILLFAVNRRPVWILGALLQVFVIMTYFNLASQRAPAYEMWGIILRIVQALILIALVYLAMRQPESLIRNRS